MCLVRCKKCQQKTSMYLEICEHCKENRVLSPEMQAYSDYHDGKLPTVIELNEALTKEQAKNAKLVEALKYIDENIEGDHPLIEVTEQALKGNEQDVS